VLAFPGCPGKQATIKRVFISPFPLHFLPALVLEENIWRISDKGSSWVDLLPVTQPTVSEEVMALGTVMEKFSSGLRYPQSSI